MLEKRRRDFSEFILCMNAKCHQVSWSHVFLCPYGSSSFYSSLCYFVRCEWWYCNVILNQLNAFSAISWMFVRNFCDLFLLLISSGKNVPSSSWNNSSQSGKFLYVRTWNCINSFYLTLQYLSCWRILQVTTPVLFKLIPAMMHLGVLMHWFPSESGIQNEVRLHPPPQIIAA